MRSALIWLFFVLIIRQEGSCEDEEDVFQPTPIPLNNWSNEYQAPAGTLQENIKTETSKTVASIPAHYWEDALRHSVYLTLVRDKIDQLISKDVYMTSDNKPDVDDHDLWEKIKLAPFDRVKEKFLPPSDSIILAKGRLFEDKNGYRFAEDDAVPQKCSKDNCTIPVKAYWSVKRVKQGDKYLGKYHYELTFSVTSQSPKILKKPFENPVRTFTIRENNPTESPSIQTYQRPRPSMQHQRAQRAVWVHKNITPPPKYQKRKDSSDLDRFFTSLFSDDDSDETEYQSKPKVHYPSPYQSHKQHVKSGPYFNDPYHPKKGYPVKPPPFRYPRPPMPPPASPQAHRYFDVGHNGHHHVPFETDNKPSTSIRTTKPAVLPTPIPNFQPIEEPTESNVEQSSPNSTNAKEPETSTTSYKMYNYKPTPTKLSYRPEMIRPPVYNAPPGVFVTMDKKPFKPLPPFKSVIPKPHKHLPSDFRPSPQIHEDPNTGSEVSDDDAFRPITLNLTEPPINKKKVTKPHGKPVSRPKPPIKHDSVKYNHHLTTALPDIITAGPGGLTGDVYDPSHWADILAAFTKTTPMDSQNENEMPIETDVVITAPPSEEPEQEVPITTTTPYPSTSTTTRSTTRSLKNKRTRPPAKFKKSDKYKNTTKYRSTSTTTTVAPTQTTIMIQTSNDLTPQASSAANNTANSVQDFTTTEALTTTESLTTSSTSTTTSTMSSPTSEHVQSLTTPKPFTTSTTETSSMTNAHAMIETLEPKNKNRFRMSTLMIKGTSVKHDKWTAPVLDKGRSSPVIASGFPVRRKASKFQGYVPSTTPRYVEEERYRDDHKDYAFKSTDRENITSTTEETKEDNKLMPIPQTTLSSVRDTHINDGWVHEKYENKAQSEDETEQGDIQDTKDSTEFIFPSTPKSDNNSTIEIKEDHAINNETVIPLQHSQHNKTKCKKKKLQNNTTDISTAANNVELTTVSVPMSSMSTTTHTSSTLSDIFDLFGGFTMDMDIMDKPNTTQSTSSVEPNKSESAKHEQFIKIDDDVANFLHSLDETPYEKKDDEYDDEKNEDSPFEKREDSEIDEYYDSSEIHDQDKDLSILELIAME